MGRYTSKTNIHSGTEFDGYSTKDANDLDTILSDLNTFAANVSTPTVVPSAASFAATAAQDGYIFNITAADKVATLPSVVTGLTYTFTVNTLGGSTGFSIAPAAADFIQFINVTDNTAVVNTAATDVIGDSMTVVGDATLGGWIVTNVVGIWASA